MALLVVWSHSFAIYAGSEDYEPLSLLMNGTYNSGNVAVLVFFVVSGFLICRSFLEGKGLRHFFTRRVLRIYPGFIVATFIGAFIIVPVFSSRELSDFTGLEVANAIGLNLLLQGYFPSSDAFNGTAINGSLWSIPFEFWCYIGLAVLGIAGALKNRSVCLALTLLIMATRVWLDLNGKQPGGGVIAAIFGWPYLWLIVLPCFMLGMCAYLYRDIIPRSRWLLMTGLSLLLIARNLPLDPLHGKILTNVLLPPVISYLTFHVAFSENLKLQDAGCRRHELVCC